MKFYKIVNPDGHHGLKYKEGRNVDPLPFNPSGDCEPGGIYFTREDILAFLKYGTDLYVVTPIGEIYENIGTCRKWKAHEVDLKFVGKISNGTTISVLINDGADVHADNNCSLRWAAENGHTEVVKVLLESGADVHADNNYALRWAAEDGHTEVVKVLLESGAEKSVLDLPN